MALPASLKNFNVFINAISFLGIVDEVKLPKLSRKMEDFQGGGMVAPMEIDLGQEKLELEYSGAGFIEEAIKQYGATKAGAVLLRFAGAYQSDDSGDVKAVEIVVRGRNKEIDLGDAKVGDKGKSSVKMPLAYYKLTVDGQVLIEIDVIGFVLTVNGVDLLEAQRKAIGLA